MSFHDKDLIGSEIANGRYKILGRVGQGSMGQVFLAHDRHLQTDIVLKFPFAADTSSSEPEFLDRFAREIRSLVELSHPHIVKVFDVGEHESRPFVAMQFLAGGSLKDRITCGPAEKRCRCRPGRSRIGYLKSRKARFYPCPQAHSPRRQAGEHSVRPVR